MRHFHLFHASLLLAASTSILAAASVNAPPRAKNKDGVYGETPPLLNACRAAGERQSFDIVFHAPVFKDGKVVKLPIVTAQHNGIAVHSDTPVRGPCAHRNIAPCKPHPDRMPLVLQGHGSPVEFRNTRIRPLEQAK